MARAGGAAAKRVGARRRRRLRTVISASLWLALVAAILGPVFVITSLSAKGAVPRSLARYVELRSSGHNPAIVTIGQWTAAALLAADRGERPPPTDATSRVRPLPTASRPIAPEGANQVEVHSPEQAISALAEARPGDVITFAPGTYRFGGPYIEVRRPGAAGAPITVRARQPGTVFLELTTLEGFLVSAPFWTFENLAIRGVCSSHDGCEHAFHVVGGAAHFVARHNVIIDFNAHVKVNADGGSIPDDGLIEGNVLTNRSLRQTLKPVTAIDLVAASHWRIRGNTITDIAKAFGDETSYAAYAKGGGADNRFEQNIVLCEDEVRGEGIRMGLSLGGGGTAAPFCRESRCITEQDESVIEANLIAGCSDAGIYVRSAAGTRVVHNTLLDTGGVELRFPETSADVEGNLVDGAILGRDGAIVRTLDNVETRLGWLYIGWHPVRRYFADAQTLDLDWRGEPPRRRAALHVPLDLCGATRPSSPTYGAFENIALCRAPGR